MPAKHTLLALSFVAGAVLNVNFAQSLADYSGLDVRFKSAHGFYLTGASRYGEKSHQNRRSDPKWTVWSIINRPDGTVGLQNRATGRFLTGMDNGTVEAHVALAPWEIWRLVDNGDGTVSLQSNAFGRFVTAMPEGPADANGFFNAPLGQAPHNSTWERWRIEPAFEPVEVTDLRYQLDQLERLGERPAVLGEVAASANGTSVPQMTTIRFRKAVGSLSSFVQTTGFQVGSSVSIKAGIPEIAEASATVSTEFKQEWSMGRQQSAEKEVALDFQVTVPPFSSVRGKVVATETTMRIPWTAMARFRNASGALVAKPIAGVWEGTSVWSIQAQWE